jgi:cytochrome c-type biogenesis protein CcmH/NrfG
LLLNSNARHIWLELGFSAAYTGKLKRATEAHQRAAQIQGANDPRVQALGQLILGR